MSFVEDVFMVRRESPHGRIRNDSAECGEKGDRSHTIALMRFLRTGEGLKADAAVDDRS